MGHEILTTGEVLVRRPDADELLAIRAGAWSYDELVDYAERMKRQLAADAESSDLPDEPDRAYLDRLCQDVVADVVDDWHPTI